MEKFGNHEFFMEVADVTKFGKYTIQVIDDVDWRHGDEVVIASTDYDWEQAEILIVDSVDGKANFDIQVTHNWQYRFFDLGKYVNLLGELNFEHFGEVYETVDMRAEVGLLTR